MRDFEQSWRLESWEIPALLNHCGKTVHRRERERERERDHRQKDKMYSVWLKCLIEWPLTIVVALCSAGDGVALELDSQFPDTQETPLGMWGEGVGGNW